MTLVSIIIPNYNHAPYLERRLTSVLNQTFLDREVICLDDASSDGSVEILRRYEQAGSVRLTVNEQNSGSPFVQWNRGASQARGKYLWFAESDDYCELNLLATLMPILEKHPTVGLAYCQSRLVDAAGNPGALLPGSSRNYDESLFARDFIIQGKQACRGQLAFRSTIPNASAVVVRSEAFSAVGGADETMRLCGDWFTWLKVLQEWDLAYIAQPLNYFRAPLPHSQRSSAQRKIPPIAEWIKVMRYVQEHVEVPSEIVNESKWFITQMWGEFAWRSLLGGGTFNAVMQTFLEVQRYDPLVALRTPLTVFRQLLRQAPRLKPSV